MKGKLTCRFPGVLVAWSDRRCIDVSPCNIEDAKDLEGVLVVVSIVSSLQARNMHPFKVTWHRAGRTARHPRLISWARPLLARITIAGRNSAPGIPESADGSGGSDCLVKRQDRVQLSRFGRRLQRMDPPAEHEVKGGRKGPRDSQMHDICESKMEGARRGFGGGESPMEQGRARLPRGLVRREAFAADHGRRVCERGALLWPGFNLPVASLSRGDGRRRGASLSSLSVGLGRVPDLPPSPAIRKATLGTGKITRLQWLAIWRGMESTLSDGALFNRACPGDLLV
ncbi:hypothetical protein F5148DRAFT_1151057 [Russula earlei]|uniref:Uncharacterized protein n=1 Tax=Russula earlei TaxID=71964 RepID=A0ACC0U406_9AGAM|nr:hypothetical protein F5148DRAFT_1151057 [Russula earlei]